MTKTIRQLNTTDYSYLVSMDTGIKDDYVIHIFHHLVTDNNFMYGLFIDDQLVSFGGYSIFSDTYAMLGRLRSDRRYRGRDLATELMLHIIKEAFKNKKIKWVGANTQEDNLPAKGVLNNLGLTPLTVLHAATTKDVVMLESDSQPWNIINNLSQKKEWLKKTFIQSNVLFPYECYYPFPSTWDLFKDEEVDQWHFYENDSKTRFLITKPDRKGYHYLQVIYPWGDMMNQRGLWETVSKAYNSMVKNYTEKEVFIWIDLTKEEVNHLPENHSFELDSPWILHGSFKSDWKINNNN